jgi:hypothetical protein
MNQQAIKTRIESFVAEMIDLIRSEALASMEAALGASTGRARTSKASGGSGTKSVPPFAPDRSRASVKKAKAKRGKVSAPILKRFEKKPRQPGEKRRPAVIAKLVERLASYIAKHPGQRIEQIRDALHVPTADMNLPIKKLIADKRITASGVKRATTYAPSKSKSAVTNGVSATA